VKEEKVYLILYADISFPWTVSHTGLYTAQKYSKFAPVRF